MGQLGTWVGFFGHQLHHSPLVAQPPENKHPCELGSDNSGIGRLNGNKLRLLRHISRRTWPENIRLWGVLARRASRTPAQEADLNCILGSNAVFWLFPINGDAAI